MLTGIRKVTRGWVSGVLIGLLILAFGIWGINDVFNSTAGDAVASGRGVKISATDYRTAFDQSLEEYRQQSGGRSISPQDARAQGVDTAVLQRLVTQSALERLAERMGFHASDAMIAKQIRSVPAFQSQLTKQFDRATYEQVLASNQLTPAMYESELRSGLRRQQLAIPVAAGAFAPKSFASLIFAFETEQRTITVAGVPPSAAGKPPAPSEAELQAFYKTNQTQFATPEYRKLMLAIARPEQFLAKIEIPEEKVKELYEFRKASLGGAEKRSFVQISAPNQETASEAARRMAAGEDAAKVAASLKLQTIPFNDVTKAQVLDPALADAVFALKEGQTTGAVNGKLAWAAAKVTKITAGQAPAYEALRGDLRTELARDEAENALNDAVQKFEDERAGGKSLEDAAKDAGLIVVPYAKVDAQGRDGGGAAIQGLADNADLMKAIAATAVNESTDFTPIPNNGGYALARVDEVIAAGVRPYDEVKPMLTVGWQTQKTAEAIKKIADDFTSDVKAGKSFTDAARARRMVMLAANQSFSRQTIGTTPIAALGASIFAAKQGEVVSGADQRGAMLVAQVTKIDRPKPDANSELFAQARQAAGGAVNNDLLTALQQSAVQEANVKTNEKLRLQALGLEEGSGENEAGS